MSVQAMGWVLDHSPARGSDRLVLICIANHAGKSPTDGAWESWPGVGTLQREAALERERTVQDSLARLTASGDLERVVNGAPDERIRKDRRPNLYRILLANGVPCGDTRCCWCGVTDGAERGDAPTVRGVTDGDATGCRETSPKPGLTVIEPSSEPTEEELLRIEARNRLAARDPSLPAIFDQEKWIRTTMASLREEHRAAHGADHKRLLRVARERGELLVNSGHTEDVAAERERYSGDELVAFMAGVEAATRLLEAS